MTIRFPARSKCLDLLRGGWLTTFVNANICMCRAYTQRAPSSQDDGLETVGSTASTITPIGPNRKPRAKPSPPDRPFCVVTRGRCLVSVQERSRDNAGASTTGSDSCVLIPRNPLASPKATPPHVVITIGKWGWEPWSRERSTAHMLSGTSGHRRN